MQIVSDLGAGKMPLTTSFGSTTVQQTFLGKIILDECTHLILFANDGYIVTRQQNKYGHSTSNLFPLRLWNTLHLEGWSGDEVLLLTG